MIEEKVKQEIIKKYGSVKRCADKINMPYTTLDSMLKRGLRKANAVNVLTLCNALELDIEDLILREEVAKELNIDSMDQLDTIIMDNVRMLPIETKQKVAEIIEMLRK